MIRHIIVSFVFICSSAYAADVPASEASIKEMLEVTEIRKLVDGTGPQFEAFMKTSMQQALAGRTISPEEQKIVDRMSSKMAIMMKEELSWEKLEPLYLSIYQKSFTQEEVDGMLAFYKSPAGIALIKKIPVVMQESMNAMQQRMGPMMERLQKAIQETVAEIEAENPKKTDQPAASSP